MWILRIYIDKDNKISRALGWDIVNQREIDLWFIGGYTTLRTVKFVVVSLTKNEQGKTGKNRENQARSLSRKNCDFMPACFVNLSPDRFFSYF